MARNAQMLCDLAAGILEKAETTHKGGGMKNLLYAAECPPGMRSMLIALVTGASKEKDQLFAVASENGFLSSLPPSCLPVNKYLLQVLLYECLLGSRRVRGECPLVEVIKTHKASLQQTLATRRKRGDTNKFVEKIRMPRYLRVNLMKTTFKESEEYLTTTYGYSFVKPTHTTSNTINVEPTTAQWDPFLPGVICLPPKTTLHGDKWVDEGKLVLQDRSSCLTALALNAGEGSCVIDTCAAPGNKTLHVASMMRGKGTVYAFERSAPRLLTLERRITQQGGDTDKCVTAVGMDFTTLDVNCEPYCGATHVLIDPSCSGSGLVSLYTAGDKPLTGEEEGEHDGHGTSFNESAVLEFARNQTAIILHAMTLPKVKVIAYSTCSVHREENEDVVMNVIAQNKNFKCDKALPFWPHRGLDLNEFKDVKDLVCRADFVSDSTNGFFVARFERVEGAEKKEKKEKKRKREVEDVEVEVDAKVDATDDLAKDDKKKAKKAKKSKKEAAEEVAKVTVEVVPDVIVNDKKKAKKSKKSKVEVVEEATVSKESKPDKKAKKEKERD